MDKKTQGILATVAAVILCGCPGLCLFIFGGVTAAGIMPYNTEFNGVTDSGILPSGYGFAMLCAAIFFIAIPIVVGFLMLRQKPLEPIEGKIVEEEIPGEDL
ncbi:MAG: hypothetical protein ISR58_12160 [Anaerolineales bacterium]|nr:hypothetical protein [Chloroflexota bacterium]MBL6981931.1 hypothetical protein [Anaerolineales bacterium]